MSRPLTCRVLVLSAHEASLDRRIVAQANTLAACGAAVTLVTVPVRLDGAGLDPRVAVIAPTLHPVARQHAGLKRLLRGVSPRLYDLARGLRYAGGRGPAEPLTEFFCGHAPPGPFDVVHCHDLPTLPAAVALRTRWPAARVIYDSHELFPCQFSDRRIAAYWQAVESRHIRAADAVVTVNPSIADELARRYAVAAPLVIFNSFGLPEPPPVDERDFAAHFGLTGTAPLVLYQGGLVADRNLDVLVAAFRELRGAARLLLLGDGPLEASLRAVRDARALDNVFFGRSVPPDRLLAYTARAQLGVIPYPAGANLNTRFCTPNKLFEFIEAGLPICASDLPELRRIVVGGGIGRVYSMETPPQAAFALRDCLARLERGEFTPAARAAAREAFSWQRQAQALLRLYESVQPGVAREA